MVNFPDVPSVVTSGDDHAEAMELAADALIAALIGTMHVGEPIPKPSPAKGRRVVSVPARVAAKLALYEAMREQGVSQAALADRLGTNPKEVRRWLDLDHGTKIDTLERALAALGKQLSVEVLDAA